MDEYIPHQSDKAKAQAAMRGMALSGGLPGRAPLGYRNVVEGYRKKVVVDEQAARLVRLAFGMVATEDRPLRSVLGELAAYGLASRSGRPLGVSSFWGMLTNPFYAGYVRYRGEIVRGTHEPLVDRRTFEAVQTRLRARNRSRRSSSVCPRPNKSHKKQAP